MPSLARASCVAAIVLASATACQADDLGRLFEKAARNGLREALAAPSEPKPSPAHAPGGEPCTVRTADGWMLVAHRFKPTSAPRPGVMPVILCHGLTYNAIFWDLDPSCSFARYLAGLGFDVWAVSLRGCGMSQKWVWNLDEAPEAVFATALRRLNHGQMGPSGFATVDPRFANWTMDQHIAYDVPALVNLVRRHTGAPEVAWVGHSMGGIVALGCLARYPNPGIGRLATIGSQVTMPEGQVARQLISELLAKRRLQLTGKLTGNQILTQTKTSVHDLFFNTDNVAPRVYEALCGWATDVPAIGLMEQYLALSDKGELVDTAGRFHYARNLNRITIPIFISCGAQDNFAPPKVQRFLYDHVGSTDKTLFIFGRSQGLNVDAGHDDSLVGLSSKGQSYPVLARWLAGVPTLAARPAATAPR